MKVRAAILGILLLFSGCSTVRVSQDYRTDIDFSHYHTYTWKTVVTGQESTDIRVDNPLLHERFHQAIDRFLVLRGYMQKAPANLLISYSYSIQTRLESEPYGPHFGVGLGRRSRYSELGFGNYVDINQYDVGILAIDFYDAVSETLIWRGIGSERVDMYSTQEETTAFVDKLVTAVLAQFPPR
ncbi:MAG: hypothetical protein A2X81_16110 [Desulfobacterales bacterium GWB2_56_26]|nr:MAG: hypothetical protein A2X81_16110 [Desulfobacterales bacterium GWB2_56_26]